MGVPFAFVFLFFFFPFHSKAFIISNIEKLDDVVIKPIFIFLPLIITAV